MSYFSPKFLIGSISIGTIEGASCINFGNNFPTNFTSHKKQNQGFGSITGDHNDLKHIFSRLDDRDVIDMYNQPRSGHLPDELEDMAAIAHES